MYKRQRVILSQQCAARGHRKSVPWKGFQREYKVLSERGGGGLQMLYVK